MQPPYQKITVLPQARLDIRQRPREDALTHETRRHLLFMDWEIAAEEIQKTLPPGLYVDTFHEKAYIGIVTFLRDDLQTAEVCLRTYVLDKNGIPGTWVYSYQLDNQCAVLDDGRIEISGPESNDSETTDSEIQFAYSPKKKELSGPADTLDFFLIERYVVFTEDKHTIYYQRVHHTPYPLYTVVVIQNSSTLFQDNGFKPPKEETSHICYCPEITLKLFTMKKDIVFENGT